MRSEVNITKSNSSSVAPAPARCGEAASGGFAAWLRLRWIVILRELCALLLISTADNLVLCTLVVTVVLTLNIVLVPPASTLLEPQPRFVDKPVKFQVVCPQHGTAVLKGTTEDSSGVS